MSILNIDSKEKTLWLVGGIVHLVAAIFSNGFYHWDEHFQIFEYADYLLGLTELSSLPWEFEAKMRPLILPYLAAGVKYLTGSSYFTAGFMRFIAAGVSLCALYTFYQTRKDSLKECGKLYFIFFSCLLWFLPFLHVRVSAEVISGALFIFAYTVLFKRPLISGILFGLCFWIRFQMGFAILGLFIPYLVKRKLSLAVFSLVGLGFLSIVGINIAIDSYGYGSFSFAPWEYLHQNIILGKSKNFGINPLTDYFKWILTKPGLPFGLLFFAVILKRLKEKTFTPLTFSFLTFFIAHLFVGHKELRFLFPMLFLMPLFISEFVDQSRLNFLRNPKLMKTVLILNAIPLVIFSFGAAHPVVNTQKVMAENKVGRLSLIGETDPYYLARLEVNYYEKSQPVRTREGYKGFTFGDRLKHARKAKEKKCELIYSSNYLKVWFMENELLKDKTKVWTLYKCSG